MFLKLPKRRLIFIYFFFLGWCQRSKSRLNNWEKVTSLDLQIDGKIWNLNSFAPIFFHRRSLKFWPCSHLLWFYFYSRLLYRRHVQVNIKKERERETQPLWSHRLDENKRKLLKEKKSTQLKTVGKQIHEQQFLISPVAICSTDPHAVLRHLPAHISSCILAFMQKYLNY